MDLSLMALRYEIPHFPSFELLPSLLVCVRGGEGLRQTWES